jgi:hypothetical protein
MSWMNYQAQELKVKRHKTCELAKQRGLMYEGRKGASLASEEV